MRESCRSISFAVFVALAASVVLGGFAGSSAQSAGETLDASNVCRAQHLLQAFYPDLDGKGYTMTLETDGGFDLQWRSIGAFTLRVSRGGLGQVKILVPTPGRVVITPILSAGFGFARDKFTDASFWSADYLFEAKNKEIQRTFNEHPSWSDERVAAALKAAGAKFGPAEKNALIANLPISALEPLIGPDFKIEDAEFKIRDLHALKLIALLYWNIDFVTRSAEGKPLHWMMTCEPFSGKPTLISLAMADRLPPDSQTGESPSH